MERLYRRAIDWQQGTILADDVGLGKTPQMIGVMCRLKSIGELRHAIVTATTSTRHQWVDEIKKMSNPKLKAIDVSGNKSERIAKMNIDADIHVVNHEMLRYPHYSAAVDKLISRMKTQLIVIDESSAMKNPATITHQAWHQRTSKVRWCFPLNATPIENGLQDLWANCHFVDERTLGSIDGYATRYTRTNDEGYATGVKNLKELRKRVALSLYRRTRDHVDLQLPLVRVQAREIMMIGKQKTGYERSVGEAMSDGRGGAVKLSKLAKVQKAALSIEGKSGKLDDLKELLSGDLCGERIVVFSRFKECIAIAQEALDDFNPFIITGDTSPKQRADNQRRFASQHGAGRVLLCTEAADRGLNLQAAGVIINLDMPWTPAKLRQRIGRINRINQKRKSILVINYIAKHPKGGTIDEYMVEKLIPKRDLFRDVLGDADVDEIGNETIDPDAVLNYISGVIK